LADKWTSSFCRTFGAADQTIFPTIQFADESPYYHILHGGASRYLKIIGDKGLATPHIQYLTPSQVGGIRSHATSPGKSQGEHTMANGKVSMSTKERAAASNATSPGKSPGRHTMANGKVSMSTKERAAASNATSPGKSPGRHTMANGEVSMSTKERMANARAALSMLVRPMNGTAHLHPNAEQDFINHCAMAKELFKKVSR
jgi:hypothetical protein